MKKVKISVQYKYLNPEIGAMPYVHIGYINENNEEIDAQNVLIKKINNALIEGTGYYYGETQDGKKIKIKEKKNIPPNIKNPIYLKDAKYREIEKFKENDIEIIAMNHIIKILNSIGQGLSVWYYGYNSEYKIISKVETSYDNILEKTNGFLIGDICLNEQIEMENNYSIEDKITFILMIITTLYESTKYNQIGFIDSENKLDQIIEFEIDGLNMDIISNLPSYGGLIYNTILKHITNINEEMLIKLGQKQRVLKKQRRKENNK